MKLDDLGRTLWRKTGVPQKSAFFAALIGGYVTHLYAFTNLIPNGDGLSRVYDLQQMTVSGRWFLHYATSLNNFTQMPAVIGLLSLLLLGLAAALTVEVLKVKSGVLGALCGAVMACFPCMGYTFLYMFTASAYCLAIFLATLSVWLAGRGKGGFLLAVLLLAMAMGTYQVYVTVAISLSLLSVMRKVMERETTFRDDLLYGLKLMGYLALGAVLYYVILLIFLKVKDLELLSYLGMDAASSGREVPHAMRVRDMKASLTPNDLAISTALSTKKSQLIISTARPPMTLISASHIGPVSSSFLLSCACSAVFVFPSR